MTLSSKQFLTDAATRHKVFLERYAGGESKKAKATLNRLRRDILARLSQEPTAFQRSRLNAVLRDVSALSKQAFGTIAGGIRASSAELAIDEAALAVKTFNKTVVNPNFKLPSDKALLLSVNSTAMNVSSINAGVSINAAMDEFTIAKTEEITQTITDAVTLGDTSPQIAKKVSGLIAVRQARQVDALVRTVINNVSTTARMETIRENLDIADRYQWIATLDNRTTLICGSRDGQIYEVGQGPLPPAHWNCRSDIIPIVKPEFDAGAKVKGKRASKGAGGGKPIAANKTYGGWLRDQPKGFVDEALGVERSKLFRSGKLTIDKFVDPTGRVYTLAQLRGMNPFIFQDAAATISAATKAGAVSFAGVSISGAKAAAFEAVANSAHPSHIAIMNKLAQPSAIAVQGNKGLYQVALAKITANPAQRGGNVFLHEYGHHIDYQLGPSKYRSISESDAKFVAAFAADRKALGLHRTSSKFKAMDDFQDEFYSKPADRTLRSGRVISSRDIKSIDATGISDIMDAMTAGQYQRSKGGYGHGVRYYKHVPARYHETFANLFYLRNTDQWSKVKKLFPATVKRFEELIEEGLL